MEALVALLLLTAFIHVMVVAEQGVLEDFRSRRLEAVVDRAEAEAVDAVVASHPIRSSAVNSSARGFPRWFVAPR